MNQYEELQVIIDSVPAWIFYKDKENRFIRVNKAFTNVMKMSKEQLEGKSLFDFYPKGQAEAFWKDDLEVIASDKPKRNIIESMTTEDGTFWVQTDKIPYHDTQGNCVGVIGFTLDITERKKVEEALLTSEALLQETSRIAKVGGWEINLETQELSWSEEVYRIHEVDLNYKPSIVQGIDFYAPEYRPAISEAVNKAINFGKPFDLELQIITAKGNRPWVHARGKALNIDGRAIKVYGTFQDITERKVVEEELNNYRNHLEEQVYERTAELTRSNKELEQFAYIASHDLQEPLRMVSSYTQLLEKRYSDKLDQDAREFIHFAVDGANRMQLLINDLLEYSRITTQGKEFKETDTFSILGQAIRNLQMKIENSCAIVTNGELPIIKADELNLVRLFQNLIDNAIKFKGTENPRVHISCQPDKDYWYFSVKDNGIGIDPKYKERVFQIFQRLSNKSEYPGTGIGLAICKRIVERHGGKIWIESEPGNGTAFLFTIKK
jgi:PAS domain S-box-containing protein